MPLAPLHNGRVAVLYPHGGTGSIDWHRSIVRMRDWDRETGTNLFDSEIAVPSSVNIVKARNQLAQAFLETDCTWALWCDTDMVPEPEAMAQLVATSDKIGAKIMGGLCCIVTSEGVIPTLFIDSPDSVLRVTHDYPVNGVVEIAATGTGFLLVHREVFEAMQAARDGSPWAWFREGEAVGSDGVPRWLGEDTTFCLNARALGYRVYVNCNVEVGHHKGPRVWYPSDIRKGHGVTPEFITERGPTPTVVVVPVKNKIELTQSLVDQLRAQPDEWEHLVIIDNGSDDGTWEWITQQDDIVSMLMPGAGIHEMWNAGVAFAIEQSPDANVAILNNDLEIGDGMLSKLVDSLRFNVVAACPQYDDRDAVPGQITTVHDICAGRYDGTGGFAGFAFVVAGRWFAQGWRFPEQCRWWYGDNWLMMDVAAAGKQCVMVHDARVVHLDGGGQTGEGWDSPEMRPVLAADRAHFLEHVEELQAVERGEIVQPSYADLYRHVVATPSDINEHLPTLFDLVVTSKATKVIELGTRSGVSTIAFLHALDQTGGSLWSVDVDLAPALPDHDRWFFWQEDDREFVKRWGDVLVDLVFIDTSHEYEHTKAEIAHYWPIVRDGGRLVFHDTNVETFDHHEPGTQPPYPVRTAVAEMVDAIDELEIERVYTNNNGLTIVRVQR